MIEDRNIICIASNWWYDPTSKHHVMRLLAERNHVIWVNYHGSRRPRVRAADVRAAAGRLRQVIEGPRRVLENLTVITPLVLPLPGSRTATQVNRRLLVRQIRSVLRQLPERPVQLWTFAPDVDYLVGRFDEECAVYYCVDAFDEFEGYDREAIRAAEARLIDKVDLVLAASHALYQSRRRQCPEVVYVPHGVDVEHFQAASRATNIPEDVVSLRRPVLGFWGLIQEWVDIELLADVARMRPEWSIVVIGEAARDVSKLSSLPNVHLLGRQPYARLPEYARAFDMGLIPFRINALTRAVNPIKLREYLAAGLPVVSTPLPEVEAAGLEGVYIANGVEAFVRACERAMAENTPTRAEQRRNLMNSESWRAKVEAISELVLARFGRRAKS